MQSLTQTPRENIENAFFQKKSTVEYITPHKLAVLCFVSEYVKLRDVDLQTFMRPGVFRTGLVQKTVRDFALLTLNLIYGPDLSFADFYAILNSGQYSLMPGHVDNFVRRLQDLITYGLNNFMDLHEFWKSKVQRECARKEFFVFRTSVVGFYARRFCLSVETLEFSELICVIEHFKAYFEKDFNVTGNDVMEITNESVEVCSMELTNQSVDVCSMELTNVETKVETPSRAKSPSAFNGAKIPNHMLYDIESLRCSRRQAELFIATQAALLKVNDAEALTPLDLQEKIRQLLKNNPGFSEAHFLSYLNCLRVKEFCGAVDSLYHSFDRNTSVADGKLPGNTDEKGDGFRYAALNLAILHTQFGHNEEALAALKEAITKAQEANDNFCLQHALTWMYKLTKENKELLIERSILKSNELNLFYNTSLGIQAYTQHMGLNGGKPKYIFDLLTKSDVINCQHSLIELLSNSYIQKAALWNLYGKPDLCLSWSQVLLNIKSDHITRGGVTYNGEGICQAICNVSISLTLIGEYEKAYIVLNNARERFTNEPISHIWKHCEQFSYYKQAYHNQLWEQAEMRARQIATFDPWQSHLYLAEIYFARQNYESAIYHVNIVLNYTNKSNIEAPNLGSSKIYLKIVSMILLAEIKCAQFSSGNVSTEVIMILNEAFDIAEKYYYEYYSSLIQLYMAHAQLWMKMPILSMKLVNKSLINVLANGSLYDRSRAMVLYVKCFVAKINSAVDVADNKAKTKYLEDKNKQIYDCVKLLDQVKINYNKLEAYTRVKDVIYLQAKLYDSIHCIPERNKAAVEFKLFLEKYPNTDEGRTLLTAF